MPGGKQDEGANSYLEYKLDVREGGGGSLKVRGREPGTLQGSVVLRARVRICRWHGTRNRDWGLAGYVRLYDLDSNTPRRRRKASSQGQLVAWPLTAAKGLSLSRSALMDARWWLHDVSIAKFMKTKGSTLRRLTWRYPVIAPEH